MRLFHIYSPKISFFKPRVQLIFNNSTHRFVVLLVVIKLVIDYSKFRVEKLVNFYIHDETHLVYHEVTIDFET